ncbi:MAG: phosphotyrosine protein phosphatase [Lachnospiraceae bacterium]|nr:phosphotyrosine protein phosphatase [Lachnospiraceae bacterium]
MEQFDRILFVCTDNTCRSVIAEAVMRNVCRERKIQIASRGLVVLFPEPLNPKAVAVLAGNQMTPAKEMSEPLEEEDITGDTLILAMTAHDREMIRERFPRARYVYTLGDYAGKPGDVEVPHGGSLADYGACCEYIDLLVKLVAERLFRGEPSIQREREDEI